MSFPRKASSLSSKSDRKRLIKSLISFKSEKRQSIFYLRNGSRGLRTTQLFSSFLLAIPKSRRQNWLWTAQKAGNQSSRRLSSFFPLILSLSILSLTFTTGSTGQENGRAREVEEKITREIEERGKYEKERDQRLKWQMTKMSEEKVKESHSPKEDKKQWSTTTMMWNVIGKDDHEGER